MTKDDDTGATGPDNASDIAFVKALAEVLQENDLGELEVERGKSNGRLNVRITRNVPPPVAPQIVAAPVAAPAAAAAPSGPAPTAVAVSPTDDPASLAGAVTSPMVGTVYLSPEPDAAPFVKTGDTVTEGQTLLIVEAMKTMNHIPATHSGTVKRILIEDGAAVEYGAPLMVVE